SRSAAPNGGACGRYPLGAGSCTGRCSPSSQVRSCLTEGTIIMAEKTKRGFAGMSSEKQREIASKGGKAAHAKGTAHHFTPEEAREAGRKGGQAAHAKGTAHEFPPEEAREAGRKGGLRSQGRNVREREPESAPVASANGPSAPPTALAAQQPAEAVGTP